MVAMAKGAVRSTRLLVSPKAEDIQQMTANIRSRWTTGQRHFRARMALRLQHQLFCESICAGTAPLSE